MDIIDNVCSFDWYLLEKCCDMTSDGFPFNIQLNNKKIFKGPHSLLPEYELNISNKPINPLIDALLQLDSRYMVYCNINKNSELINESKMDINLVISFFKKYKNSITDAVSLTKQKHTKIFKKNELMEWLHDTNNLNETDIEFIIKKKCQFYISKKNYMGNILLPLELLEKLAPNHFTSFSFGSVNTLPPQALILEHYIEIPAFNLNTSNNLECIKSNIFISINLLIPNTISIKTPLNDIINQTGLSVLLFLFRGYILCNNSDKRKYMDILKILKFSLMTKSKKHIRHSDLEITNIQQLTSSLFTINDKPITLYAFKINDFMVGIHSLYISHLVTFDLVLHEVDGFFQCKFKNITFATNTPIDDIKVSYNIEKYNGSIDPPIIKTVKLYTPIIIVTSNQNYNFQTSEITINLASLVNLKPNIQYNVNLSLKTLEVSYININFSFKLNSLIVNQPTISQY